MYNVTEPISLSRPSLLSGKRKSRPCQQDEQHQGHLEGMGAANGVTYEDILAGHHPTRLTQGHLAGSQTLMPLEILDVKLGDMGPPHIMAMHHAPCYPPSRDTGRMVGGKPFHHPVYEEVSQTPTGNVSNRSAADKMAGRSLTSDEDLADEEGGSGQCSATSSVRGSTGGDLCRDPVSSDGEDCVEPPYPVNSSFGYNPKPGGQQQTYPEQRTRRGVAEPFRSSHSNKPNNGGPPRPSHIPSSTFGPRPVDPRQWMASQCYDQDGYPQVSASQENIYSTIDEDEEYPVANPLTSLAQRGSPMGKGSAHGLARPPLSQRKPDENGGSSYGDIMPAFHSASFM
ncbi:hypothetical protein JTE90_015774 [Oedothorax gibbosus]|uniref:Uncharacterized protein n=1 Tax=Oedothorax gibbosus TaxID=931172 RepID=A0AAV6VW95_9ARAC|nr:hypothetical protein JTE90_015774 [Oedothorax gibbosus]